MRLSCRIKRRATGSRYTGDASPLSLQESCLFLLLHLGFTLDHEWNEQEDGVANQGVLMLIVLQPITSVEVTEKGRGRRLG